MADVNANIRIGIDSSSALAQLKTLQSQISQFNNSVVRSNAAAVAAQQGYIRALDAQVSSSGRFITSVRTMESSVDRLGSAFDKGTLSTSQYFRTAMGSTRTFGRFFRREMDDVTQLAERRVKALQTQYVALGRDAQGAQRIMAMQPTQLATGYATNVAMAHQKQILFNRALQLGTTNLVNWGKNTQWAGRQLMVGFTVPLTIAAGAAAKFFMDIDKAGVAFRRVYGDFETSAQEAEKNLEAIKNLATEYTKYGLAVSEVIDLGARAAATGATNEELLAATEQTLRLATLGQMDYNEALDTTISLQTAFQLNSQELAEATDFLNAVENQTVLTIEDLARAIPRVAPVIKGLGGDVKDLAVFMTALREGGVTAEQGANALKSGLASLINPTNRAQEALNKVGININAIVEANKGDLMATVTAFGEALSTLSEFEQQRALEQVFGKFQYARIGALFKNIARDGSQAATTLQLAGMATEDLASLAESELSKVSESVTNQFLGAVERLKAAVAPIGEMFLKAVTPIINAVVAIADKFNSLPDAVKQAIGLVVAAIGLIAPALLMGIGLIANGIGNGLKAILVFRNGIKGLIGFLTGSRKSFEYNSIAAIESATAMSQLDSRTSSLTPKILMQAGAVDTLTRAYGNFAAAAAAARAAMPQGFVAPPGAVGGRGPIRRAAGGFVPGSGNGDTVPALLTPGEFVVNRNATEQFAPILSAINSGNIPGFAVGGPVGFDVGGRQIELSVGRQSTIVAIQRRIDAAISMGAGAVEEFATVLSRFADRTGVTVSQIDQEIRKIPKIAKIAAPESYSAPTFIQTQSARMDWTTRQQEISAIQESVAQDWPEIADDTKKMRNLTNTQASHIEQINTAGKNVSKDWTNLANLTPDLGGINNYLNRVKGMNVNGEVIEQIMAETGLDMRAVNTEVDKLKAGIHPTTRQAASVLKSLANLDANLSRAAISAGKTATALGTTAATGYQATAVSAALSTRLSGDFYETLASRAYQPAGAAGAAVAGAMSQGGRGAIGAASPAKEGVRLATDYVDGIELGARQNAGQARSAGASIGSAFNQGALSPSQTRGAVILGQGGMTQAGATMPLPSAAIQNPQVLGGNYINPALENQLNNLGNEVKTTTAKTRNFKEKISAVSGKAAGLGAALTGATIAASFMDGQVGEIAQQAMPVIFGLQGLSMALPMLTNPVGLAVAAFAAVGGGLWFLNSQMNSVRERGQEFADALTTSAEEVAKVGEFFGNESLITRQQFVDLAEKGEIKSKDVAAGLEFIGSDIGQEMAREFTMGLEREGGAVSARRFANKLGSMMMQGVIDFPQAKQIAVGLAQELGQAELSADIVGQLKRIVGPDGKDISKYPLQIAAQIVAEEQQIVESLALPVQDAFNRAMSQDFTDFAKTSLVSPFSGLITQLGIDIPYVTDISKNLMSFIDDDFEKATESAQTYGKALGNSVRNAYDNLNSAIIRNEKAIEKANKADRPELRRKALIEEQKIRDQINESQQQAEQNFAELVSKNAAMSKEVLDGMQVSLKEIYSDPQMQMILDSVFARTGGLDQEVRFNILMNLQTGQLNPMAANSLFDMFANDEDAATTLNILIERRGLDSVNEFLMQALMIGDEEVRKRIILQYVEETGGPEARGMAARLSGFGEERRNELVRQVDAAEQAYEDAYNQYASRTGDFATLTQQQADDLISEYERGLDGALNALTEFDNERKAILEDSAFVGPDGVIGPWKPELLKASAESVLEYISVLEKLAALDIKPSVDLSLTDISEGDLRATTKVLEEFSELPEDMQKTVNVDVLQATANMDVFNIKWSKVNSFADLQKQISVLDGFSSPMEAFAMSWADFSRLPNIYREIVVQYTLAVQRVEGEYRAAAAQGVNLSPDVLAGRIGSQTALAGTPFVPPLPTSTGGGTTGGGTTGGGGGGTKEPTGAELLKQYIEDLKIQKTLIGRIKKEGGSVVSGFAQALRNAGAPEQLIADIISKGKDGIKIAKELLKDRAKELKELTQLMFSVNRLAFVESQRSAAENARAQRQAQQGLLESGFSFDVAQNVASDENTAAAVADSYARVQAAEREVASTEKGTAARKKANEELRKAREEWNSLTTALQKNIAEQEKLQIADLIGEAEQEANLAARKISAGLALIGKGFNSAIVGKMIVDPAVVNQVSGYVEKLRDLERQKKRITDIDKKDRTDEQKEKLRRLNRQIERTEAQYRRLIKSLRELSEAEKDILVTGAKEGLKAQTTALRREERATNILMGMSPGMTYDEASSLAQNEDVRDAILVGQSDITDLEKKKKTLLQQRQGLDPESEEYKELTRQIKATNRELKKAKEEQKGLVNEAKKLTKEERKASWRNRTEELNKELSLQKKRAKLVEAAGGDQLVLNYLTSMSYEDIVHFLSLSKKEQKEFVELLQDSFTAADKIAQAFDQINENQEYSNSLIEQQANEKYGVMDQYNEEERSLDRQIRATNDLIEAAQDQVDVIQEQNDDLQHSIDLRQREIDLLQRQVDDYNRGLELIQRQEDDINEYYDKRLEALDKVDEINQRIAQRQRDQLALSQALSEGDIYAAAQAAQQARQSEATNALQESRNALEEARQNAIDDIATDINGTLLNREQIEKRLIVLEDEIYEKNKALLPLQDQIYANEQLIYNIQEDTLEPLEAALDALEDQKDAIADLKKDWQDYYDYLAENAVDPLTGMKFKDLEKLRNIYEAERGRYIDGRPITEEEALQNAINNAARLGIDLSGISEDALRRAFGVTLTIPVVTENTETGGSAGGTTGTGSGSGGNEDSSTEKRLPKDYEDYAVSRAKVKAARPELEGAALTEETRRYRQGLVNYFAGGKVLGSGARDSVPIMASPGEFVVRNSMVKKYSLPMLNKINQGSFKTPSEKQTKIKNMSAEISGPVYNNYSVSVTANTNANADEIANKTITKIKQLQTRSIRSSRV